jgi:hypothetical protein
LEALGGGRVMIDPDSRLGRELKAAEEFFASARTAPTPFMRSYYQRVAERYLSSKGELKQIPVRKSHRFLAQSSTKPRQVNIRSVAR